MPASQSIIYPDAVTPIWANADNPVTISTGAAQTVSYGTTTALGSTIAAGQSITVYNLVYILANGDGPVVLRYYNEWDLDDPSGAITDLETIREGPFNVKFEAFGAAGDGVADDTVAIQAAIAAASAAGGGVVYFPLGTYLISGSGSTRTWPSVGATTYEYCLSIPSGVTLDLAGSTLKLAAGETDVIMLCNSAATNTDIGIIGYGTVDGSDVALTDKPAAIWLEGVTGLHLDLKLKDTYRLGLNLIGSSNVTAPRIHSDGCTGTPLYIGRHTAYPVTDSHFGSIISKNVVEYPTNPFNFPGNGLYCVLQDCVIDSIQTYNTQGGVKFDIENRDVSVGQILMDEGTSDNSGVKFQGDGAGTPLRVHVGHIDAKNQDGPGLYMEQCVDCSVGSFIGKTNARDGTYPDVWIGGTRDSVGIINSNGAGLNGVIFRATATDAELGSVKITNCNVSATASTDAVSVAAATGHIDSLICTDTGSHMFRAFAVSSVNGVVTVGRLKASGFTSQTWQPAGSRLAGKWNVRGTTEYLQIVATDDALLNISSTAALGLDNHDTAILITGTAAITSITATYPGHLITLQFDNTAATTGVTDGSNLKLAGNFVYTPDDTITLLCNGTNWYEVARSAN